MSTSEVLSRSHPGRRALLKREILLGALTCFLEEGLEAATIQTICRHCQTSVGNLYHHFGNKDGLIAALFFCALEDQARSRDAALQRADSAREGVAALVGSYADWVTAEPELARFQFMARSWVSKTEYAAALDDRNSQRNRAVRDWFAKTGRYDILVRIPPELTPSLIIGPAESYCRAWLAGRVSTPPASFRTALADAAWAGLSALGSVEV